MSIICLIIVSFECIKHKDVLQYIKSISIERSVSYISLKCWLHVISVNRSYNHSQMKGVPFDSNSSATQLESHPHTVSQGWKDYSGYDERMKWRYCFTSGVVAYERQRQMQINITIIIIFPVQQIERISPHCIIYRVPVRVRGLISLCSR